MPLVRNASGREYVVPAGHWALEDEEFVVLPEPEPEPAPAVELEPAPVRKPAARKPRKE